MAEISPRIAVFLRCLSSGGVERMTVNLVRGFTEQGIKVDLILSRAEGPYLKQVPSEVRIIALNTRALDKLEGFKLPSSFQSTTSLPKLIRYLQQERPVALLSAAHYSNEIAILAKRLSGVPTRVVVAEHTNLSSEARRKAHRTSRFAPLTAKLLYPWADEIVTVSQGVAIDLTHLTNLPLERFRVIYNPVLTPDLPEKAKEPVNHPWFAEGEPPVVLGVGRLATQKDFPTLIRAFAKVRQVQPARLLILGSGSGKPKLLNLIHNLGLASDVALPGFVENPYSYMSRAAVFVLSSIWEGMPTVLIEAMALKTPVVSTDCESGPAEVLGNGKYGHLVPVGDSDAMAEAILRVLSGEFNPIDSTSLNQFTLATSTQHYLDVLGLTQGASQKLQEIAKY